MIKPVKCPCCGKEPVFTKCDTGWYVGHCDCKFPYSIGGVTEEHTIQEWNNIINDYVKDQETYLNQ